MDDKEKQVPITSYSKAQLCLMYGVGDTTFRKWISLIENKLIEAHYNRLQSILTVRQVKIVFDELSPPNYDNYVSIMLPNKTKK